MKQCQFFAESIDYFGYVIGPRRFGIASQAADAVPDQKTQQTLQNFVFCSDYVIYSEKLFPSFLAFQCF